VRVSDEHVCVSHVTCDLLCLLLSLCLHFLNLLSSRPQLGADRGTQKPRHLCLFLSFNTQPHVVSFSSYSTHRTRDSLLTSTSASRSTCMLFHVQHARACCFWYACLVNTHVLCCVLKHENDTRYVFCECLCLPAIRTCMAKERHTCVLRAHRGTDRRHRYMRIAGTQRH